MMKETQNYDAAAAELNSTAKKLVGLELKHLKTFPVSRIVELTMLEKDTASVKLYVTGVLLKEEASLLSIKGKHEESEDLYLKSFSLLLESYLLDKRPIYQDHTSLIDEFAAVYKGPAVPDFISEKIFSYYEYTGQFGKAEDTLFELIERNQSYIKDGILFYDRLLEKTDDDLSKGNLPREEVEEALSQLKAKLNLNGN